MKDKYSKVFIQYLLQHKKAILCFATFVSIACIVFFLYQIDREPIIYTGIICLVLGILFLIVDSINYYHRHQQLDTLKQQITLSLDELPSANNLIEADYQQLLEVLFHEKNRLVTENDKRYSETIDYYTMWVHQIKTPIAAMRLLLQSEENSANNEMENELFKIEQYVEMVLSYLRIDSSSSDYVFEKHDLDTLIRQSIRKYAKMFILKKLTLNYEPIHYKILTDEKWFCFVFEQLLSNAIKYTPSGSISVYMEKEGVLVIEDSGIGIAPSDQKRIFEKGFTGYNGHDDKKSSGLGLYLCQRIVTQLGHQISVESEVGKGTKMMLDCTQYDLKTE